MTIPAIVDVNYLATITISLFLIAIINQQFKRVLTTTLGGTAISTPTTLKRQHQTWMPHDKIQNSASPYVQIYTTSTHIHEAYSVSNKHHFSPSTQPTDVWRSSLHCHLPATPFNNCSAAYDLPSEIFHGCSRCVSSDGQRFHVHTSYSDNELSYCTCDENV